MEILLIVVSIILCGFLDRVRGGLIPGWKLPAGIAYGFLIAYLIQLPWFMYVPFAALWVLGSRPGPGQPQGWLLTGKPKPGAEYEWWQKGFLREYPFYAMATWGAMWGTPLAPLLKDGAHWLAVIVPANMLLLWYFPQLIVLPFAMAIAASMAPLVGYHRWDPHEWIRGWIVATLACTWARSIPWPS